MTALMEAIIKALSWTFLHSFWQGLFAAVLAAIIISATRRSPARIRYNLLGLVLVLFLAGTLFTFQVQWIHYQDSLNATTSVSGIQLDHNTNIGTYVCSRSNWINDLTTWLDQYTNILVWGWLVFFILRCIQLFAGMATVGRLRHYKTAPGPFDWETKLPILMEKMGVHRSVKLLQSRLVNVPVALGFLKPVILVPIGLLSNIPPEQAESILLHELAHIRRKDYLVNILQRLVDAIFFFNPSILWISSLLRQEREACCDDLVVSTTGKKRDYVDALVSFQEYSLNKTGCAMTIGDKRQFLLNRVKRMLTNENKSLNVFEKIALGLGLIVFSAFLTIEKQTEYKRKTIAVVSSKPSVSVPMTESAKPESINRRERPSKKRLNKASRIITPLVDTILPVKDSTRMLPDSKQPWPPVTFELRPDSSHAWKIYNQPAVSTYLDAEKKTDPGKRILNEIIAIKVRIGRMKDDIGVDKEILKNKDKMDRKIVEEVEARLDRKRKDLDLVRDVLDDKRDELKRYEDRRTNRRFS